MSKTNWSSVTSPNGLFHLINSFKMARIRTSNTSESSHKNKLVMLSWLITQPHNDPLYPRNRGSSPQKVFSFVVRALELLSVLEHCTWDEWDTSGWGFGLKSHQTDRHSAGVSSSRTLYHAASLAASRPTSDLPVEGREHKGNFPTTINKASRYHPLNGKCCNVS